MTQTLEPPATTDPQGRVDRGLAAFEAALQVRDVEGAAGCPAQPTSALRLKAAGTAAERGECPAINPVR